jgi:SAM-dependent methyltransferase
MESPIKNLHPIIPVLQKIVYPFNLIQLFLIRNVRHAKFWWHTNERKYRPNRLWGPVLFIYKIMRAFHIAWEREKTESTLRWFDGASSRHYSEGGPGYDGYAEYTNEQCIEVYKKEEGRLSRFYKINPNIFGYKDGDSFLDAGCGMGQNIKVLSQNYSSSRIEGFDMNPDALRIIRVGSGENKNINVRVGSVSDFKFLSSFQDNSFDHVIISHVFTFLLSSSIEKTRELRQSIINELVRISNKSFLIIDSGIFYDGEPTVEIESNTRCAYREPLEHYFHSHLENADAFFAIPSNNTGCIFLKKSSVS